jgi:hypothetical protein
VKIQFLRSIATYVVLAIVAATGGFESSGAAAQTQAQSAGSAKHPLSISVEMTDLLIGLIAGSRAQPGVNAVDAYATAFHWRKTPPETNKLLNAKVGYAGKVANQIVFLGSDGTNDIISVSARNGFQAGEAVAELQRVYRLKKQDSEDSDGQRFDAYILVDGSTEVGVVMLTYGIAAPIQGGGTVSFMAMDRVRKGLATQREKP